jgi:hypothetical protein
MCVFVKTLQIAATMSEAFLQQLACNVSAPMAFLVAIRPKEAPYGRGELSSATAEGLNKPVVEFGR